ncbi:hypothetical protein BS467_07745 [Bacillus altitudinis]|uniref:hypothetical protein n=1 Tax=Bacillus altitudinis TaxID=293387 RepID=UPI00093826EC|nr:hypothetical protein [Bacillus altitudinis]APP15630.1 hypothetical protein BS467_07745 [Bacillus altitudinis]
MIHVLKDEKLGVDREYVAVDRGAEVGEKIVIVEKPSDRDCYSEGDVFTVDRLWGAVGGAVESDKAISDPDYNKGGLIVRSEYRVLEPTDIVHIDGERYRLEDRKADVGDEVIYAHKESGESDGIVSVVSSVASSGVDVIEYEDFDGETVCGFSHGAYRVLTPIQDAAESQESDVITVLANLGAEVAELKRKNDRFEQALGWNEMGPSHIPSLRNGLDVLKSVISELEDKYESELERMQSEINALHEDKVRLGEQLAKVAADDPKSLSFTAADLAQVLVTLKKAGL